MNRAPLLKELAAYSPFDPTEAEMLARLRRFVAENPACFHRSHAAGHITGSAWILDLDRTHALLVHHRRLDRWLQPGGHVEDDSSVLHTARREAIEEAGLADLEPISTSIFDVDVHPIPPKGAEPAHFHYDLRYVFEADRSQPVTSSHESRAVAWVPLDCVRELNPEPSVTRLVAKTLLIPAAAHSFRLSQLPAK